MDKEARIFRSALGIGYPTGFQSFFKATWGDQIRLLFVHFGHLVVTSLIETQDMQMHYPRAKICLNNFETIEWS